jgi:hypothetical protein
LIFALTTGFLLFGGKAGGGAEDLGVSFGG